MGRMRDMWILGYVWCTRTNILMAFRCAAQFSRIYMYIMHFKMLEFVATAEMRHTYTPLAVAVLETRFKCHKPANVCDAIWLVI